MFVNEKKLNLKADRNINYMEPEFENIDDFLDYLPEDERRIATRLRELILDAIPDCSETFSHNVPYYHYHGKICYIRPAAIPRGNVPPFGVELGFIKGYLLGNEDRYLRKGRRKKILTRTFAETGEIDPDRLRALLYEAIDLEEDHDPEA